MGAGSRRARSRRSRSLSPTPTPRAEAAPEVIDISDAEPLSEVQAEVEEADEPDVASASLVELASEVSAVTEDPEREVEEEDDEPVAAEADEEEPSPRRRRG